MGLSPGNSVVQGAGRVETILASGPVRPSDLCSRGAVNLHRNGDQSREIFNQNCRALRLNDSLCRPIAQQSTNRALGGAYHLGQVLTGQVDPGASDRTLPLQD